MVKTIRAGVKITPKLKDTFYSFEYSEEREIDSDTLTDNDFEEERNDLWDTCFNEVAKQINQTQEDLGLKKRY